MQYFRFTHLGPAPDGMERKLRFDINTVCELEDAMDKTLFDILRSPSFNSLRYLVWAGLKWQDPALTASRVGELMQKHLIDEGKGWEAGLKPVMDALLRSGVMGSTKDRQPKEHEVVDLEERPTEPVAAEPLEAVVAEPQAS